MRQFKMNRYTHFKQLRGKLLTAADIVSIDKNFIHHIGADVIHKVVRIRHNRNQTDFLTLSVLI